MSVTPELEVVMNTTTDEVDLDSVPTSPLFTAQRSRTLALPVGRNAHYLKVMVLDQILPGESEQDFRDRMDLLITREASAEVDAFTAWMKENDF